MQFAKTLIRPRAKTKGLWSENRRLKQAGIRLPRTHLNARRRVISTGRTGDSPCRLVNGGMNRMKRHFINSFNLTTASQSRLWRRLLKIQNITSALDTYLDMALVSTKTKQGGLRYRKHSSCNVTNQQSII